MATKVMEMQDHFESVREVLARPAASASPHARSGLDWDRLVAAANVAAPIVHEADPLDAAGEWLGVNQMPGSTEWQDIELLLRTFRELGVRLLLLDIPWYAPLSDEPGVNAGIRDAYYYSRLRSVADKYGVPIATFQDHEYDLNFLRDSRSHLSAKGWIFFDRDMDAFWRGLPLSDH